MARIAVGLVFLAESNEADDIINEVQQQFDIQLLHAQTSYSKLWITKQEPQQENSHEESK